MRTSGSFVFTAALITDSVGEVALPSRRVFRAGLSSMRRVVAVFGSKTLLAASITPD
jgi:hypothetical protein